MIEQAMLSARSLSPSSITQGSYYNATRGSIRRPLDPLRLRALFLAINLFYLILTYFTLFYITLLYFTLLYLVSDQLDITSILENYLFYLCGNYAFL
jgi:hypothetical protein